MKDYYSILEITIEASIEQIKKAYRKKAIEYHPDKHNGDKYFTNQFVEIKEAYDVLSDNDKRLEYDLKYFEYFVKTKSENKSEVKTKVKFQYKPHQKVYSFQERFENETSNVVPKFNHWGNEISSNADFFKFPKNIGKIISGHTTLNKDKNPSTNKDKQGCVVKAIIFSIIFSGVVIFGIGVSSTLWICFWALFPIIFLSWFASGGLSFEHTCSFIGVNGFAEFRCSKNKSNIIGSFEINYRDVTDVLVSSVVKKINFNYLNTYYSFTWLKGNEIVKEFNGTYNRENSPEKDETNYWLNCFAEKNWTIYLLDNMEKELELNGYILFSLYVFENEKYIKVPYIHLGVGFIKFITAKEEFVYNFNEIKKVYIKRSDNLYLYIEHSNYDRKFLFFESGNKSCIPLLNLSNQKYFFQAFELLLGYKFS